MKTSKIAEKNLYSKSIIYTYCENLPSADKWIVEHTGKYEIESLRKPIKIISVGTPNYEDVTFYDEFGIKSSNVDYTYDINDYNFYKVIYELIDFNEEDNNNTIESYEDYEYIYVDKYIDHDIYMFESDINEEANEIKDVWILDEDHYYGDCYPEEVENIKSKIEYKSLKHNLKAEEYRDYIHDIRNVFDHCARNFKDNQKSSL